MPIRKTPEETAKRREDVKEFMETIGPYSVPVKTLAGKHEVTVKVVYNDIKFWLKKLDFKDMDLNGKKMIMSLLKNMSISEELKAKGTPTERIRAIQAGNQTAEVLTKIMENYGFKEKIPDNVNVTGNLPGIIIHEVVKTNEQIKEMKNGKGLDFK